MKSKRHVRIHANFFKWGVNKKSWYVNKKIAHINSAIQYRELEINNKMTTCADKYKQTSSEYDIKGKEKTLIISEKEENAWDGNVCIYECGKILHFNL